MKLEFQVGKEIVEIIRKLNFYDISDEIEIKEGIISMDEDVYDEFDDLLNHYIATEGMSEEQQELTEYGEMLQYAMDLMATIYEEMRYG